MKKEYWKQIDDIGTYNTYYVSNKGRISNQNGKVLKQQIDKYGYSRIMLRNKTGGYSWRFVNE